MPLFVTELRINDPDFRDGRPFCGPKIVARDFQEAEDIASETGFTALGEFDGEIPCNLSRKETKRRLAAARLADCRRDPS